MLVTKKTKHVTYKNNDWACHKNEEVQSVQMNICQSNTYRNNLRSTLAKGSRETTSEGPAVLHIRFSNIFKRQLGIPAKTQKQCSMQGCMADLQKQTAASGERKLVSPIFNASAQFSLDVNLSLNETLLFQLCVLQFLCKRFSSFDLKGFCQCYEQSCSLCKGGTFFIFVHNF